MNFPIQEGDGEGAEAGRTPSEGALRRMRKDESQVKAGKIAEDSSLVLSLPCCPLKMLDQVTFKALLASDMLELYGLWPPAPGAVLWFLLPPAGDFWEHLDQEKRRPNNLQLLSFPSFPKGSDTAQPAPSTPSTSSTKPNNACSSLRQKMFSIHILDEGLETRIHKEFIMYKPAISLLSSYPGK